MSLIDNKVDHFFISLLNTVLSVYSDVIDLDILWIGKLVGLVAERVNNKKAKTDTQIHNTLENI